VEVPRFTVEEVEGKGRKRKTRKFSVRSLGWLWAPSLWEEPDIQDTIVPAWLAFHGTEAESQAFTANVRCGRRFVDEQGSKFVLPKKVRYAMTRTKVADGVVTSLYLPELFNLEPAVPVDEEIRFLFAPCRHWLETQARTLPRELGEDALDAARGALFAAYLDRRLGLPLLADLRFQLRLYRAALTQPWTTTPTSTHATVAASNPQPAGLDTLLAVSAGVPVLEAFVSEQTRSFYQEEISHGPSRIPSLGRLLPDADAPVAQLRLDLAVA
jgi:hypothetical protein